MSEPTISSDVSGPEGAGTDDIHLSVRDIRRSFRIGPRRIEVLRGVSMEVRRGELVFLVGASGAGKTTLLYTMAGLERPEAGTVLFENRQLYSGNRLELAKMRNERMGFIFQGYFLLAELTALENVMLPMRIDGRPYAVARKTAEAVLDRVGLGERKQHMPPELSGGEQQRVAIARAIVNNPSIIFADEPTGNLDSKTGEAIVDLLLALVKENRKTLVVVTHDAKLADRGDRKVVIADGMLVSG